MLQKDLNLSTEEREECAEGWHFEDVFIDPEQEARTAQLPIIHCARYSIIKEMAKQMRDKGYTTIISQPDEEGNHKLFLNHQKDRHSEKAQVRFNGYKEVQNYDPESGAVGQVDEISLEDNPLITGSDNGEQNAQQKDDDSNSGNSSLEESKSSSGSSDESKESSAGQSSNASSDRSSDSSDSSVIDVHTGKETEGKGKIERTSTILKSNLRAAATARQRMSDSEDGEPFDV